MVDSDYGHREELRSNLETRFSADSDLVTRVMRKVEEAQQMEKLEDLHWDNPEKLADDIEAFSKGNGLKAGWNTWIGIQRTDTSHLTLD